MPSTASCVSTLSSARRSGSYETRGCVRVHIPPLRARGSDILLLAQHWPGNVRELQNCVERAVALARFDQIGVDDLPEKIRDFKTTRVVVESEDPSDLLPMEEVERRYILRVLDAVGGNKTMAAHVLGFDRRTLYRKLEGYGIGEKKAVADVPAP